METFSTSIFEDADYDYGGGGGIKRGHDVTWGCGPYDGDDGGGDDAAAVTACGSEEKAAPRQWRGRGGLHHGALPFLALS